MNEAPVTWRNWMLAFAMMGCSWLSYVDRQMLAVLAPTILAATGMSTQSYSEVVSAFSICYMISNPLWGVLLDRVGLRTGMLAAVGLWSIASASHAWAAGFAGFAVARALLGLGEGATFPGGLRTAMDSLPANQQSMGMAVAFSGGSLGAILAPLIVVPLATRFGWQTAFLCTGAFGILWLVWWSLVAPRRSVHPANVVWPNLFERRFWALALSYAFCVFPLAPILYLSPLYLSRVQKLTQTELGKVLWIPALGWEAGYFFWGWAVGRFAAEDRYPLRLFVLLAALGLPLGFVTQLHSSAAVIAMFFWAMFVGGGFIVLTLRTAALAYPRAQTALVAGIGAGAWSALVALLLPGFGRWFDRHDYGLTFVVISLMPTLGMLAWSLLAKEKKLAERGGFEPPVEF